MVKRAARKGGAELVDTYTATIGHDVCQLPHMRYVEGVIPLSLDALVLSICAPESSGAAGQGAQAVPA